MNKSQAGFSAVELLLSLVLVAVISVAGWIVWHNQKNPDSRQSSARMIYGDAIFIEQGPTDAPIGEKPASATLLVGSEQAILKVLRPLKTESGSTASYSAKQKDIDSDGTRVVETSKGSYQVELKDKEDSICLVQKRLNVTGEVDYTILLGSGCITLNSNAKRTKVDISTIGFGANSLNCSPASACKDIKLQYD